MSKDSILKLEVSFLSQSHLPTPLKLIGHLQNTFDYLIDVKKLANNDFTALNIMGRPDLLATFTKIALWHQTQFRKIVYLDADTLPLRALEELFDIVAPFAAAPEIGFPDCFNSGVMVLEPSAEIHQQLLELAVQGTSFDGGDQGLLNIFFKDFYRLSFMYNVELYRTYRLYMPAMRHYIEKLSVVHFIGKDKPWDLRGKEPVDESAYAGFYYEQLEKWWKVCDDLTVDVVLGGLEVPVP
jgi:glycogenin glucosyltransferase